MLVIWTEDKTVHLAGCWLSLFVLHISVAGPVKAQTTGVSCLLACNGAYCVNVLLFQLGHIAKYDGIAVQFCTQLTTIVSYVVGISATSSRLPAFLSHFRLRQG